MHLLIMSTHKLMAISSCTLKRHYFKTITNLQNGIINLVIYCNHSISAFGVHITGFEAFFTSYEANKQLLML